jgi:hypothetical protein
MNAKVTEGISVCDVETSKHKRECRICGSRSGGNEELYLLGYNTVQSVESQPTFRRNMSPTSTSFMLVSWTLKTEATCYSETLVDFQRTIERSIPEDINLQEREFSDCSLLGYSTVRHNRQVNSISEGPVAFIFRLEDLKMEAKVPPKHR